MIKTPQSRNSHTAALVFESHHFARFKLDLDRLISQLEEISGYRHLKEPR